MKRITEDIKSRLISDTVRLLYFKNRGGELEKSIQSLTNAELLDLLENAGTGFKILNRVCAIIDYEAESRGLF